MPNHGDYMDSPSLHNFSSLPLQRTLTPDQLRMISPNYAMPPHNQGLQQQLQQQTQQHQQHSPPNQHTEHTLQAPPTAYTEQVQAPSWNPNWPPAADIKQLHMSASFLAGEAVLNT